MDFHSATFNGGANFSSTRFRAEANFRSAKFSAQADFSHATFSATANFVSTTFSAAVYFFSVRFSAEAIFQSAEFSAAAHFVTTTFAADADFLFAKFSNEAKFLAATFIGNARFNSATFTGKASFNSAKLKNADFNLSVFQAQADFSRASFNDSIHFFGTATDRLLKDGSSLAAMALGIEPSLDFQHVRIEHPDRIAFHTLSLRPHWFVNVDSREFVFTDVSWEHISIKEEIAALEANKVSSPNRLLAITCRQLAENAETNSRYEDASRFRYWAMELQRQEMDPIWKEDWYEFAFWRLDWWYWATSGYGERIARAFLMLFGIWVVFTLLYLKVGFTKLEIKSEIKPPNPSVVIANANAKESGEEAPPNEASAPDHEQRKPDEIGEPLPFKRALTYSLEVMSLQKPEPRPLTNWAHTLVTLETILGPVQAALLALAIRRKFMR